MFTPNFFTHLVMALWLPAVLGMFLVYRPRRAIIASFVIGWLFLPVAHYDLPGIPDWDKMTATNICVLLGACLFDINSVLRLRFRWYDIPMVMWILLPFVSSVLNTDPAGAIPGLDAYEGFAAIAYQVIVWGVPYFIGRIYFNDLAALKELALGMVVGAIIYIPLCLFEMRMSPVLHLWFYGYDQVPAWRYYPLFSLFAIPYQPRVFMYNGLALTMWMACCSLLAFWLWYSRAVRAIWGIPMVWWATILFGASIACKAAGANVLLLMAAGVLWITAKVPYKVFAIALLLIAPTYMFVRATGLWSGEPVMSIVQLLSADRAQSLATRFRNEDELSTRAFERPVFGWGRFGRSRLVDESGKDISVVDGLWIATLGQFGLAGLAAMTAAMLLPLVMFVWRIPPKLWAQPNVAPVAALTTLVVMFMLDNLSNAFPNPLFTVVLGGVISVLPAITPVRAVRRVRKVRSVVVDSRTAGPGRAMGRPAPHPRH